MATYYAYGRKDSDAPTVDPIAFGEHYAAMWADVESGATAFCPSVQDAFGYFLTAVTS